MLCVTLFLEFSKSIKSVGCGANVYVLDRRLKTSFSVAFCQNDFIKIHVQTSAPVFVYQPLFGFFWGGGSLPLGDERSRRVIKPSTFLKRPLIFP